MSVHHLQIYVRLPCQGIYSAGSGDIQPVCYQADVEDSNFQEMWLVGICAATLFHDGVSNLRNLELLSTSFYATITA